MTIAERLVRRPVAFRKGRLDATDRLARLAAIMGVAFAGLFVAALAAVHSTPGPTDSDAAVRAFYLGNSDALVVAGCYLVPFAGIAFLWHLTTLRSYLRARSPAAVDGIPYALQLPAGLLFVALVFAGAGAATALALQKEVTGAPLPSVDVARGLLAAAYSLVFVYAVRCAGMYAIATTTLLRRAGVLPGWAAFASYLLAAALLVSTTLNPVVVLLFPTWALVIGVALFHHRKALP